MKIAGITGGIGSGKTSVCSVIKELGYPVYIADSAAKQLMQCDQNLIDAIKSNFGQSIYTNSKLNRTVLAEFVFNNSDRLNKLNSLVHPAVAKDFEEWSRVQKTKVVFKEAAILFETGGYKLLDQTILVHAPVEQRITRVMNRDKVTKESVLARMDNQWPDQKKIPLADYIIQNHNGHLIIPQILELISRLEE
jgi:dephospho-CoA kinase